MEPSLRETSYKNFVGRIYKKCKENADLGLFYYNGFEAHTLADDVCVETTKILWNDYAIKLDCKHKHKGTKLKATWHHKKSQSLECNQ